MRERAAAVTRSQILQAAASVFASNGYPLATINEIASHAEVGVNTVYTVFGTKANLLAALISEAFDNPALDGADHAVGQAKTGPAVIREITQLAYDGAVRRYDIFEVGSQNSRADPQIAEVMGDALAKVRDRVRAAVARLIELDVLSPDLSLEAGTDILYFYVGPPAWTSLVRMDWPLERARDFLCEQASRALLRRGRRTSS